MIWQTSRFAIDLARPQVMGIVNVTPDSFSDGGRYLDPEAGLAHARRLIAAGADVNAKDAIQDSPYLYAGARGHPARHQRARARAASHRRGHARADRPQRGGKAIAGRAAGP